MINERECMNCGKVFMPMFAATKYCTVACREAQTSLKYKEYKKRSKQKKNKTEQKKTIRDVQAERERMG